ncbi:GNAT family N-acetyltransferase [Rhodoblastus acidophilus]|uniref:GNAT family N-acetyltransferase n=1 Tax=Candidatus Rhodoblastus alkanivorans TaxID=2954117 RepID=A0ABS9ZBW4_9HYPH|nr:GNAT family N-acetyltransferase [Candidatus Rhodoblastus alkanivorans]MCI4680417.1 GNAT family N-acetyltransferase [Candidatus Rhodoblastus alkanivorans]MCI4685062.1 GNAT family N-acetyltransferase [Candidatus Rhodoblastus alkanivorans]
MNLSNFPTIETQRLRLTPLTCDDATALQEITNDPVITNAVHFLANPFTSDDAAALIIGEKDDRDCFIGAWDRDDLVLVGVIGTHLHGENEIEIGYWIKSSLHGLGFGSEAAMAVIAMLRGTFPTRHITAECRVENIASWRLLEKLGFRPSGEAGRRPGRQRLILYLDLAANDAADREG